MNQLGSVGLIAGLTFAVFGLVAGGLGGWLRSPRMLKSAERAALAFFVMITLAVFALEYMILTDDFHNAYVAGHSNRALPTYYKVAALWAGQEGSLLFWTWLLALYGGLAVLMNRSKNQQLMPYVIAVLMVTSGFFTAITFFAANPFAELYMTTAGGVQAFSAADGKGLNPLLQYHSMVIHPPMLYLGYVGFVVPFAFAVAALITKQLGDNWIRITRRWTMVPWMFLGAGILLGGRWAYSVLGWGGYWGWDPVENASLLPYLSGTAFLHSVMIQEKRGMLKVWNIVLVMVTYFLCVFGTFLTRSGIVSSVHAFAQSGIGPFFAVFLGITTLFSVTLIFMRLEFLKSENKLDSMVSRESGFLFNNWVLLASVFAVLWGTLFPVISQSVVGETVTVGAPYFNKVAIPIGLLLLLLTGAGPLLAWRKTSFQSLKRNFTVPLAIAVVAGVILAAAGVRHFYAWVCLFLSVFVGVCTLQEFYKGARTRQRGGGENFFQAIYNLTMMNTRRYGGYVVHLGIVMLFVGFAGQAFQAQVKGLMAEGDELRVKDYVLRAQKMASADNPNYSSIELTLDITKNGKPAGSLAPDRRFFKASEQPTSHVAIKSGFSEDLYTVLAGQDPESGKAIVEVFVNPLVRWVWIGGFVMFFGTLLALVPSRAERQMAEIRQEQKVATVVAHAK